MNIWLSFIPGSGASVIEMLLRSVTDFRGLPVSKKFLRNGTAHGARKQWHPDSKALLLAQEYTRAEDNVFTPVVPMSDMTGPEIFDYINTQPGVKFYLGPSTDITSEFALVAAQKVPGMPDVLIPDEGREQWSTGELEPWETREHISRTLMQWWLPTTRTNWIYALQSGDWCVDTMDLFTDLQRTFYSICEHAGVTVTNHGQLEQYCYKWTESQNKIWQDWKNLVQYKQGLPSSITGGIIHESIIQYHLREQGIELKCYGLNTFPNSEELKQYYD